MKKLIFQELMIASDLERSAERFQFGPKMNLILGKTNKVGKTSLCTSLFWALGCKTLFPPQWSKLSIKTILKFSIEGERYTIVRTKDWIALQHGKKSAKKYSKVTGDFARDLSDILNFNAYLKPKGAKHYHPAFPSAQFLSSFIHSDTGWGEVYKSFSDLDGYSSSEKKYLTEYLIGIRGDDFFSPRKETSRLRQVIEISKEKIGNFDEVFESISNYLVPKPIEIESKDYGYRNNIDLLLEDRSFYNHLLISAKSEKYDLKKQIELVKKAESELFLDYNFATNDVGNTVLCPTCGVLHENDIVSRFNILDEREALINNRQQLENDLVDIDKQVSANKEKIEQLSAQIVIEEKLLDLPPSINDLVKGEKTLTSIISPVIKEMVDLERKVVDESTAELERFPKFSNNASFKKHMSSSKAKFASDLIENLHSLNVSDADEGDILDSPYNKIHVSGSDISRMTLAYYKTLNDFIINSSECVPLPMVIDSPIQQEQDETNIKTIVDFLKGWDKQQVLIFGKEYPEYISLKNIEGCNILDMNVDRRILSTEKYQEINRNFIRFDVLND
ncbi:hypothetical protein [Vibrio cyclitrophicus]|uniref:hypothetical protein n=1 Tax=Vibrio cyclitrophicus TaxID=47951 RepID=UPI0002F18920|nr:hypothetical protein [Vibrio cyclitrophicus]OED63733.1 hypothetical protein OAU_17770 [Vibrio cyclitrophicus ZF99]